jgi:hypothetical protein
MSEATTTADDKAHRMRIEAVVAYFKELYWHFMGGLS